VTLIDDCLPVFDAVERHSIVVNAPADRVYTAIRTTDFARSPIIGFLLALRALPALVTSPRDTLRRLGARRRAGEMTLDTFLRRGFVLLDEQQGRELLIGLVGRFWRASGELRPTDARSFRGPQEPGTAQAAWNFSVEPVGPGRTRLATETRIRCADAAARARFRLYWLLVRPGSGLIRRLMLRAIRQSAELRP
jgi:hypothetical protein